MTTLDLDAIKAQLASVTQGEWRWDEITENLYDAHHNWLGQIHMDEDAAFVVSAAKTIRDLVAEVERLTYYLREIEDNCKSGVDDSVSTKIVVTWALSGKPANEM